MEIVIKREIKGNTYTAGKMYVDDWYFADTLEPRTIDWNKEERWREKPLSPKAHTSWK